MGDIYVILLKNDVLDGKIYRSFDEAKQALIKTAMANKWRLENNRDDNPIRGFENQFDFDDGDKPEPLDFPEETGDLTELNAKGEDINVEPINIRKLTLNAGGRRKTARTIRMKKSEYLREHHHLFRVLRNPTRRALNAELRSQKRELKERGLKG
jgi:hypothetical protein